MVVSTPLLRSLYHLPLSIEAYEKFQEHISIIQSRRSAHRRRDNAGPRWSSAVGPLTSGPD